jgi:hypothetical protein
MSLTKDKFCLFFSLPLTVKDWDNLDASHAKLVMLPYVYADVPTLIKLNQRGCSVVIRLGEGDYYGGDDPGRVMDMVLYLSQYCPIYCIIVGVEPENGISFKYGAPDWGQLKAYEHRARFDAMRLPLQAQGFKVVSPGWTMRSISEDEPPQPGKTTWREICTLPQTVNGVLSYGYDGANGCGVHIYQYGWDGPVDELRLKFAVKDWQSLLHQPLYIDELGITGKMSQQEKMAAYTEIADILMTSVLGQRIELITPFVSNGTPNGQWSPGFLLTDPVAYQKLGQWISRK